MIPRVIHHVWVGPKEPGKMQQRCFSTWKEKLPDYTIRSWTEKNAPMNHPYVQAMYKQKKWAFVSDYIRFWALYNEGGIYLDSDMEVLRPLDNFLNDGFFAGKTSDGMTACGIIGSRAEHPLIARVLHWYDTDGQYSTSMTSPKILTRALKEKLYADVQVYGPNFFYPCDAQEKCSDSKLASAYTNHLWAESWVSCALLRKALRKIGLMKPLKRMLRND